MKTFLILLFSFPFWNTFQETATVNRIQKSAHIAYKEKDYRKAISEYETLINVYHCTDIRLYHNLGTAYFRILQYKQAEKVFRKIIARNEAPYNSYCYNNLGVIYFRSGQYPKAQQYFKNALSLFPENQEARFNYEAVTLTIMKDKPFMSNEGQDKKSKQTQQRQRQTNPNQQAKPMVQSSKGSRGSTSRSQQNGGQNQNRNSKGNEDALTTKRLQEMNMSQQNAEYLLELLRQREIQYIHQQVKPETEEQPAYPNW